MMNVDREINLVYEPGYTCRQFATMETCFRDLRKGVVDYIQPLLCNPETPLSVFVISSEVVTKLLQFLCRAGAISCNGHDLFHKVGYREPVRNWCFHSYVGVVEICAGRALELVMS